MIPLLISPTSEQQSQAEIEFEKIENPMKSYRGKYIFSFFLIWTETLANARRTGTFPFNNIQQIRYNRSSLTERSLASRSEIPIGLREFIGGIQS